MGMPEVKDLPAAVDLAKNPLADTHEFKQACCICYVKTGEGFLQRSALTVGWTKDWMKLPSNCYKTHITNTVSGVGNCFFQKAKSKYLKQ